MRGIVNKISLLIATLFIMAGCGGNQNPPFLLGTVPSDAAAVFCFDRCGDGLSLLLDSTDVLRNCLPGRILHSKAVISFCYNGSPVPLLAVSVPGDSSSAVRSVCELADSCGLAVKFADGSATGSGHGVLLVSRSESLVESALWHMEAGSSILDANGFCDALAQVRSFSSVAFLNNDAAGKLLPKKFVPDVFSRAGIVSFVRNAAQWTVLSLNIDGKAIEADVICSRGPARTYYSNFILDQPVGAGRLGRSIPASATFALSVVVADPDFFRESYIGYLDANVRLDKYRNACRAAGRDNDKTPEEWVSENDFREVGLVRWDGRSVLLARPSRSTGDFPSQEFGFPGYLALMYGNAFALPEEQCVAGSGPWLVIGSRADVDAYASCDEWLDPDAIPSKPVRFVVYDHENNRTSVMSGMRSGIKLNVYETR